tara:strand:+ start:1323 stop:3557 length:2235 start_codon:yes stop_codon:yes gene_type:complete
MAEKIVSPGVFTNEIDQSFLPAAIADIGAALIGPTVNGPAGIPTIVTSFSDFQNKFGDVFKSGSDSQQFLTSHAAEQYLKNSNTLTVVRIMAGTFSPATATITNSNTVGTSFGSASIKLMANDDGPTGDNTDALPSGSQHELTIGGIDFVPVISASLFDNSSLERYVTITTTTDGFGQNLRDSINSATIAGLTSVSASYAAGTNIIGLTGSSAGTSGNVTVTTGSSQPLAAAATQDVFTNPTDGLSGFSLQGGTDSETTSTSFVLRTIADGTIMNNADSTVTTNSVLVSGSKHNLRFEISNVNNKKGTFTLSIRRGDDNVKRKQTLESFTGVNLDPNSPNFISKVIGDQRQTVRTDENGNPYLQLSGSYPNKSRFVTVEEVNSTIDYLDENGEVRVPANSASLPSVGSGSSNGGFTGGADGQCGFDALGNMNGSLTGGKVNFYEFIDTQTQGLKPQTPDEGQNAYVQALNILSNQDEYDINLILAPGIIDSVHPIVSKKIIDVCEDRADCFAIIDPVVYGKNVSDATARAEARDSNFAAMYWPWVKVPDSLIAGTQRWVPPSVTLGGVYAFNDQVAHPWFAPAGLNRGGIDVAVQAERKLTQSDRDTLYDSNVNPIATFPGQGVTVFGQKTLQKKASALDRINVRRLLIRVKKFIASSSRFLVFEQNTAQTRNRFLGIVNPFLDRVQSQSGLSAFRVVMDSTNNTPDTIDRNQLVGQLFLQPTRTAEFIVLDFTIQPTGAAFPE